MSQSRIKTLQDYDDFIKEIHKEYHISEPDKLLELTAFGLLEEAGEVAGKMKRKYREGEFDKIEIAKEMGDVLGYLTALGQTIGISLEEIANLNQQKLLGRKQNNTLLGKGDNR
jgi:NTP pyrophosphatase (non-canonical NTP hydrolase)